MFASSMEKSKPAIRYGALRDSAISFKFYAISICRLSNDSARLAIPEDALDEQQRAWFLDPTRCIHARSESKCRRRHFHH
mmetsp:Transcript_10823/g.19630  ORF Transcript_10823/g.19630 Transcript_10823/m.19630 type:complete len:80 (+) Transcript_10823:216-455(+)